MLRRVVCVLTVALLVALGFSASAHADTISYTETFQNTFSSTNSGFTGSASPYPAWTISGAGTNSASVTTPGTLVLTTSDKNNVTVSAAGLTGGSATAFDVSSSPLKVSAMMSAYTTNATYPAGDGWLATGLQIGGLKIGAFIDYSGGKLERIYYNGGWVDDSSSTNYATMSSTPFEVIATLSEKDANNYTLDYSFGGIAHALTVAKTDVGSLDSVGVYVEDIQGGGTASVTSFSVSQVPEPSTLVLMITSVIGLLAYAWRKRR